MVAVVAATLPLTVLLVQKQQNNVQNGMVLPAKVAPTFVVYPTPAMRNNDSLSCSDCVAQGKDTICFNVEANRATCRNARSINQDVNVLCRKCAVKPTCIQPPPCVYSIPRCLIPEPSAGWCPYPTPHIPTPTFNPCSGTWCPTPTQTIPKPTTTCPYGSYCPTPPPPIRYGL